MRIAITGSTGLIGSHLVRRLAGDGHDIVRLVRGTADGPGEIPWDPDNQKLDPRDLAGVGAVVHLAGAPVGGHRWTPAYKQTIRDSRVRGTETLARAIAAMPEPPAVLLSGSATGWYGDTGTHAVDETAPAGSGFLAEVVRDWEGATQPAEEQGVRVVHFRTGIVLAADGGLLADGISLPGGVRVKLLSVFRAGLGGRLGSGAQYLSWISLHDEIEAIRFLLVTDDARGVFNLTAPNPVTNAELTSTLARLLHRPAVLPVPAFALRAAVGEFADDALSSQRVLPHRLIQLGFDFRYEDLESALRDVLRAAAA